ncbi:MAG TPA: AAA family ATPase [Nitrosopumilaceae archaeon]|nr:AAA family ATPase [Nitrosopumilaceae archaeon]
MLTEIELGNFLSHHNTKLPFDKGVTVFVGHNGAGKSSVIDGITFALFGQHTRNSNKGLIRRGANQGYAKVDFTISGRAFEAVRKIDSKGTLAAQFFEKKDGALVPLAAGERKQFGESMTKEIESLIGMDFDKLKIASIVRQGELNSIIDADPRKFKELVNAIIGIDKLDTAFGSMKDIIENFRDSIRKELEYDDTDIESLRTKLDLVIKEISDAQPQKEELVTKKQNQERELTQLQEKIDAESPKESKIKDLDTRKSELVKYVKTAITSLQKEILEKQRKLSDCEGCFDYVSTKKEIEAQMRTIDTELESTRDEIRKLSEKVGKLGGQEELATKLKLKDGKCPVCDSVVDDLNPLFQEEHIRDEIAKMREKITSLTKAEKEAVLGKRDLETQYQKAIKAENTLKAHAVSNPKDLMHLKEEITKLKTNVEKIPVNIDSSGNLVHLAIDSHSQTLLETISSLQEETKGFDLNEFKNLKGSFEESRKSLSIIDQHLGAITQKILDAKHEQDKTSKILGELVFVKQYVSELDEIRSQIFNRDGPVATSLRSWALNLISQKASEYLSAFNVKIQRVSLEEKARDVRISCYSGNTVLDLESLSGGEKVSVALALRLGMAHILGASNLNFIILDEPTTHLDEERRKSLVNVLSQAFEANLGSISQFIIITHDSEIFENSNVDMIYNFESTAEGTKVTPL